MRTLILAGLTMVTVASAGAADAQRIGYPGASYPVPGQYPVQQYPAQQGNFPIVVQPQGQYPGYPSQRPAPAYPRGSRWGGQIGGHWYGGMQAPGGWNAYRRPARGWQVPSYWVSPSFNITDYASYGLSSPPQGYSWHRYYDDAVLIDARGRVWDSRGGVDWDGGGYGGSSGGAGYSGGGYAGGGYAEGGYAEGGAGGYASSSSGYGYSEGSSSYGEAGYAPPQQGYAPAYPSLPPIQRSGAVTTYQTGGYPGSTTTVVTIQPTETVTTTTTEYVEQTHYATARHVYRAPRRHYYHVVRRRCGCQ